VFYDLARGPDSTALFIDEIDESLHPALLQGIIRHFNCEIPVADVRGQLIFVTHETALLDAEAKNALLRRDQVYLVEKDASGAARLYSVAEFKERNNLNLRRRYLQGRYGALPSLGSFKE
jgi:AAA15 family ATPase/GTPase